MGLDWRMQSRINDVLEDDCFNSNPSNLRGEASGEHRTTKRSVKLKGKPIEKKA